MPQIDAGNRIKAYPSLAALAMRYHVSIMRCFRAWTIARHIDAQGAGRVRVSEFETWTYAHGFTGFGNLRALLAGKWAALFWHVFTDAHGERWIELRRLELVAESVRALNDNEQSPVGRPVLLDMAACLDLTRFKAHIYAAGAFGRFDGQWTTPKSRAAIRARWGVSVPTQIKYEEIAHVETRPAHEIIGEYAEPTHGGGAWTDETGARLFWMRVWLDDGGYRWRLCRVMPNEYRHMTRFAAFGRMRSIALGGPDVNGWPAKAGSGASVRYFTSPKAAAKRDKWAAGSAFMRGGDYVAGVTGRRIAQYTALACAG
jgi:hypothetical protein